MIDTKKISTAYAEVLAFIDALGDSYMNKIPAVGRIVGL